MQKQNGTQQVVQPLVHSTKFQTTGLELVSSRADRNVMQVGMLTHEIGIRFIVIADMFSITTAANVATTTPVH